MKKFFLLMCSLLLVFSMFGSAGATTIFQTASLTGNVEITGLNDGDNTFTANLSDLSGSGNFQALPNGMYDVFAQGNVNITGLPSIAITNQQLIYSGYLGSTGLTTGNYPFFFGSAFASTSFDFTINYDGDAGPLVMAGLSVLGFQFVNPDGAGTLHVTGSTDGVNALIVFEESDLTWTGFGGTLAMLDSNNDGILSDTAFSLTDVTITANPIPEPATMLLFGLGLLGLAGVSRKKE